MTTRPDVADAAPDGVGRACGADLSMAHGVQADSAIVRRILREAVTQIRSIQRATRLRRALGRRARTQAPRFGTWPDFLLWLTGIVDAGVVAHLVAWRGDDGIGDLEQMAERALARFRATVHDVDEAPLLTLFEEELVRLGLLAADVAASNHDTTGPRTLPLTNS